MRVLSDYIPQPATEMYVNAGGVWQSATALQVNDGGWQS